VADKNCYWHFPLWIWTQIRTNTRQNTNAIDDEYRF
jgi:hypothetical protein